MLYWERGGIWKPSNDLYQTKEFSKNASLQTGRGADYAPFRPLLVLLRILLIYISGKGKKIVSRVLARRGVNLGFAKQLDHSSIVPRRRIHQGFGKERRGVQIIRVALHHVEHGNGIFKVK